MGFHSRREKAQLAVEVLLDGGHGPAAQNIALFACREHGKSILMDHVPEGGALRLKICHGIFLQAADDAADHIDVNLSGAPCAARTSVGLR
jgi:hypothetical protein